MNDCFNFRAFVISLLSLKLLSVFKTTISNAKNNLKSLITSNSLFMED